MTAELSALFRHNNYDEAYKIAIFEKDAIIEKIYNHIFNIHYLQKSGEVEVVWLPSTSWDTKYKFEQKNTKIYMYRDFDIVADLYENYYKTLKKVKTEFGELSKIKFDDLIEELKKRFSMAMNISGDFYYISLELKKNHIIKAIVEDITSDNQEKTFLLDNYNKVLNKILKQYQGDIISDKHKIQRQKERARQKNKNSFISWALFNSTWAMINKKLPASNNPKSKR